MPPGTVLVEVLNLFKRMSFWVGNLDPEEFLEGLLTAVENAHSFPQAETLAYAYFKRAQFYLDNYNLAWTWKHVQPLFVVP